MPESKRDTPLPLFHLHCLDNRKRKPVCTVSTPVPTPPPRNSRPTRALTALDALSATSKSAPLFCTPQYNLNYEQRPFSHRILATSLGRLQDGSAARSLVRLLVGG